MKLLLSIAFAPALLAQTFTFAPNAQELRDASGGLIRNLQLVDVTVCAPAAVTFSGGRVIEAAKLEGYRPVGPNSVKTAISRKQKRYWRGVVKWAVPFAAGAYATLTGARAIRYSEHANNLSSAISGTMALGSTALIEFENSRLPDSSGVLAQLVDSDGSGKFKNYSLAAGECSEMVIGVSM